MALNRNVYIHNRWGGGYHRHCGWSISWGACSRLGPAATLTCGYGGWAWRPRPRIQMIEADAVKLEVLHHRESDVDRRSRVGALALQGQAAQRQAEL